MATVERGKGKRKQVIAIVRQGSVLRRNETESGDPRLTGYQRFATEAGAEAALRSEIKACLADRMLPADEEARAIAAQMPSAKSGTAALPVRTDLGIDNEANGFVITSRKLAGRTMEEGSAEWMKAVKRGDMLPLELVQDDPFVIRVVAGEPLDQQEAEEWVARVDWHLNVPDGKLCITGGAPFTTEGYDADDADAERYVGELAIPRGRYRATLYTYLDSVNGASVMDHLAGGYGKGEPVEQWRARTRPDPGSDDGDTGERVDFLLHLDPVEAAPTAGLSALPEGGWFGATENAHKPERCPMGLAARDVVRPPDPESGAWTYVHEVHPMLTARWKTDPGALAGGGLLSLPLARLGDAGRIAWFASRQVAHELRLKLPAGTSVDLGAPWGEGVVAVEEHGVVRVLFSADLHPNDVFARLGEVAPRLASLPEGTMLDLVAAPLEPASGSAERAGWLWLRGAVRDGNWRIARAHPAASQAALDGALTLAAEMAPGTAIRVRDEAEAHRILAWIDRRFPGQLDGNAVRVTGDAITLGKAGPAINMLGIAAFALRFEDTWPVSGPAGDDVDVEREGDDPDDDGMFPTSPIQGALIHTAASGRAWHQTMALLLSEKIADRIGQERKALKSAGFRELGDLMSPQQPEVAYHGFIRKDGSAFAWFRVSYPDKVLCELASPAGGEVLVTTQASDAGASVADLVARHDERLAALGAEPGAATLLRFAETLERIAGGA